MPVSFLTSLAVPADARFGICTSTLGICAGCHRRCAAPKTCSRCKCVVYGSVECQTKHWSTHKASCKALAASVLARGPSSWERSRCSVEAAAAAAASAAGPRYGCAKTTTRTAAQQKETTSMPQAAVCAGAAAAPAVEVKVEVEEFDGSYACLICSESVRGTDALACSQCSSNPFHRACASGSRHETECPTCAGQTVVPWNAQAKRASAGADIMEVDLTDLSLADTPPRAGKPASNAGGEEDLNGLAARGFDLLYGRVGAVDSIAASPDTRGAVLSLPEGPQDDAAAHRLLKLAAERGHAAAQYSTALQYHLGGALAESDAEKNKAESLTWIQRAAEQGHAEAQMTLGAQYWLNGLHGHRQVSSAGYHSDFLVIAHLEMFQFSHVLRCTHPEMCEPIWPIIQNRKRRIAPDGACLTTG